VLYEDSGGSWRIQAVPVEPSSFYSRKKLLEPFMGLRDDELSDKVILKLYLLSLRLPLKMT
jgi:uncharacterized UPF0160 family protein